MGRDERFNLNQRRLGGGLLIGGTPTVVPFTGSAPLEAKGRELQEGDEVLLTLPSHYYRVCRIEAHPDPSAPPGMKLIHLGAMVAFTLPGGQPAGNLIRVQTAAEAGPNPMALTGPRPGVETTDDSEPEQDA